MESILFPRSVDGTDLILVALANLVQELLESIRGLFFPERMGYFRVKAWHVDSLGMNCLSLTTVVSLADRRPHTETRECKLKATIEWSVIEWLFTTKIGSIAIRIVVGAAVFWVPERETFRQSLS